MEVSLSYTLASFAFLLLLSKFYSHWKDDVGRSRGRPFPPGPRGLPLVGNFFDFPQDKYIWKAYRALSSKYGSMTFLQAFGQKVLIINDHDVAVDLLEKRSAIYSSRPDSAVIRLTGWDWSFAFMPYGQTWRRQRRIFWQYYRPGALPFFQSAQEEGVRRLLKRLLLGRGSIDEHLHYAIVSIHCLTAHGLEIKEDDSKLELFEKALQVAELLAGVSSILEFLPSLASLPAWLPGMGAFRRLPEYRDNARQLRDLPWSQAKDAVNEDGILPSIASSLMEKLSLMNEEEAAEEEHMSRAALALSYQAGTETFQATLQLLFVVSTLYPESQRKAQAELDAFIGPDRLPTFADRESLPYLNAFLKELFRWQNVIPLCIAHSNIADDEYRGYFIPAGTTTIVNAWAILHDPEIYPSPDEFDPERFLKNGKLNTDILDPLNVGLGYGRRICPGRHFADATMFLFVASILHVFQISPPLDEKGNEVHVEPRYASGLVSLVKEWGCRVKPRSLATESLVLNATKTTM